MNISSQDIRSALEAQYTTPEWYLGFEVGNSTGSDCRRHADAVAVNAYPSKGFEIRGFEIKISKSDLKSELENGLKSDEVARYCDYWFLVVPKGLADEFTLPITGGVIEYQDGKLRQKTKATRLDKQSPSTGFLCAMLRGRDRAFNDEVNKLANKIAVQRQSNTTYQARQDKKNLEQLLEKIEEIKEKTGIELSSWSPAQSIIDRLNAAQNLNVIAREVDHIQYEAERMLKSAEAIRIAAQAMNKTGGVINEGDNN